MTRRPTFRSVRLILALAIVAAIAAILVPSAGALAFADEPCIESGPSGVRVCPAGAVETAYSIQLKGRSGCEPHHKFRVLSGGLPPGLSLSSGGLLSGTPSHAGGWSFYLEVSDIGPEDGGPEWCTVVKQSEREFSISIAAGLVVTTASAPPGAPGSPYSLTLTAAMKTGPDQTAPLTSPVSWSIVDGQLPPGLGLGQIDGVISGSPTVEGTYTFAVRAALGDGRSATRSLSIEVKAALAIINPGSIPRSQVGVPVRVVLGATGGTPPYTWTLSAGELPLGVALTAVGSIVGRPMVPGVYPFTASVADSGGQIVSYSSVLNVAARLTIASQSLRPGMVGRLYRARIAATGGIFPRTWRVMRGPLPRGVRLDRTTGVLIGTPRKAGRYRVRFQVVDALGVKTGKTYLLRVAPAPKKKQGVRPVRR